jgi:hypothetical protein
MIMLCFALPHYPLNEETRNNRPDTVSQRQSAENCASHMPSLKAQEHGKSEALNAAMLHGRRLTNSIRPFL